MIIKLSREFILVTISVLVTLVGVLYYGSQILVRLLRDNANDVNRTFETRQLLIGKYSPNEELLTEYESKYLEAECLKPIIIQTNQALINLETLVAGAKMVVLSLSN